MPGNVNRIILDWSQPALPAAAAALADRYAAPDDGTLAMKPALVVLPGARAGRRLLELLLELADERKLRLIPPRIVTTGALIDLLHTPPLPVADEITRRRAWAMALHQLDAEALAALVPDRPTGDALAPAWNALAQLVEQLHTHLASELLTFADVPDRAARTMPHFADQRRWQSLAAAHGIYQSLLSEAGRIDPQDARLAAIAEHRCRCDDDIHLIAVAEMPGQLRAMLAQLDTSITTYIHAPKPRQSESSSAALGSPESPFDQLGCLTPDFWQTQPIPLTDEQIHIVSRPIDQAGTVVRIIASLNAAHSADQITIGLADPEVAPYLNQRIGAYDLPLRDAAGTPLNRTAPYRFLDALARFIAEHRYSQFASWIRHPDVTDWLAASDDHAVQSIDDWGSLLDRYYNDHLQSRLTGDWLSTGLPLGDRLAALWRHIHTHLLQPLAGSRPLAEWSQPILDVLVTIFGRRDLDRSDPADRLIIESCSQITATLTQLAELPATLDAPTDAGRAISLALAQLSAAHVPPEPIDPAIEMLGPLELHLDDAAVLIITGFNEGRYPQSVNADAFLPDALRHALGLMDNARRYARDLYQLTAIAHSRPHLHLIAGRLTAQGDPLTPSRLLLTDPKPRQSESSSAALGSSASTTASRILRFYRNDPTDAPALPPLHTPASKSQFNLPPQKIITFSQPIPYLRVTDFKAILEDPYRFALQRAYQLDPLDDAALELDAAAFGSLAHLALQQWADSPDCHSTDASAITDRLLTALDQLAGRLFHRSAQPAVKVQITQLTARLRAFAQWQADWAAQGWRVIATERNFRDNAASLIVDGTPMPLHGRIDRIDFNPTLNRWAIIDYKTSESGKTPEQTHRKGPQSARYWVDLQLPLYRHLLLACADDTDQPLIDPDVIHDPDRLTLGYLLLPRNIADTGFARADWSGDDLRQADETAAAVVRLVRTGRFEFDPNRTVSFDHLAELCGTNQFLDDEADDKERGDA